MCDGAVPAKDTHLRHTTNAHQLSQEEEEQRNNSKMPSQEKASVWIQLYVGATKSGHSVKISPIPDDMNDLTEEIKVKVEPKLNHCAPSDLNVFAVGTQVPTTDGTGPLDPGETVPGGTTSKEPLIVVAPLPPPQQQEGRMRCCASYSCVLSSSCETIQKSHDINCWDDRCLMTCVWTDL